MATPDGGRRRTWRFRLNDKETLEVSTPPRATEKQVRRRGRVSLLVGTLVAALGLAGVAYADAVRSDSDVVQAGLQSNAVNVNLSAGGSTTITVGVQVISSGSVHATFPVSITASTTNTTGTTLAAPSPTSLSVTAHGDVGEATTQVQVTAPTTGLTCGVNNAFSGRVAFTTLASGFQGSNNTDSVNVNVNVAGPACSPSDTTPPVITPNISGTLGNNGWYVGDVSVSWTVVDNESAVSSSTGCGPTTITSDTAGTTLTCSATSAGGTASESVTIKRDATAPTISGSASPAANGNGWNNTDVAVSFTCSDAMSGVASCGPNQTLSSEGANQSASGTALDNAGNTAGATVSGINIDKTAPTVSLVGGPADGGSYYFGLVPAAPTCSASDALSGLDGACSVSGYGNTVGPHTVTASATDKAGNSAEASNTYTVLAWTLHGFFRPVEMGYSVLNTVKGGSTVPLKFRVFAGTTELTDTAVVESLKATPVACNGATEDPVEDLSPTGGTSLRYDTTDGQFIYNWQTPKQPGKCYRVTLTTDDGSTIVANFKLK